VSSVPDVFAELLAEAEARLETGGIPEDWGDELKLAEGEHFSGRFRGTVVDTKWDPPRDVFLLAGPHGRLFFLRSRAMLASEFREADPSVGDAVVIVRGPDANGKNGAYHVYSVRSRPSAAAMPEAKATQLGPDDDLPF
jgi:hypothetical protein